MDEVANAKICVVGLGYVGLPLAVEFGKKIETVGYDLDSQRIRQLKIGFDKTHEVSAEELKEAVKLTFSTKVNDLKSCNIYIVTVPTPIDTTNAPDFSHLIEATEFVGTLLSKGNTVIFESTVYPGATEEVCVPILENTSTLKLNHGFYCGYSPERINPGDKEHRISSIVKLTSGSNDHALKIVNSLYSEIIKAGVYPVSSIRVAEAAKVIENTQRDINIALMNELSMLFSKLNVDTAEVLEAAKTKWNFIDFTPGLVGGHCIGVDPYYLAYKAKAVNYEPEVILSGRRVNDSVGSHITTRLIKSMIQKGIKIHNSEILILGLTFKANCPDVRNSKVLDIVTELNDYRCKVSIFDPWVQENPTKNTLFTKEKDIPKETYSAVIIAVDHNQFKSLGVNFVKSLLDKKHVIFDVKSIYDKNEVDERL